MHANPDTITQESRKNQEKTKSQILLIFGMINLKRIDFGIYAREK